MSEIDLIKKIVRQATSDLFSKSRKKRNQARDWLMGTYEKDNPPVVTLQECCDVADMSIFQHRKIMKGILDKKISRLKYRNIMKDIENGV